jgi:hypothetical protein
VSPAHYQRTAERFNAFFNRLTKARLSGSALAPAIAEAVGHELSSINAAADLPPAAAPLWDDFLSRFLGLGAGKAPPADPLAVLRGMSDAQAEEALEAIGEIQMSLSEATKRR